MGFQERNGIPQNKKALEKDANLPLAGRMCFSDHQMSVLVGKGGVKPNSFPWICTLGYSNLAGLPAAKPKTVFVSLRLPGYH